MNSTDQLTALQAAAALPYGELRILIALTAKPNLTRDQIAEQLGVSPSYLTTILPALCRKRVITRRVRIVGDDQVESVYVAHPLLDLEVLAAQYTSAAPRTGVSSSIASDEVDPAAGGAQ